MRRTTCTGVLALALVAGCSAGRAAPAGSTDAAPRRSLPSPQSAPVLTLDKGPAAVHLDQAGLDAMASVEGSYYEPFLKRDVRFRGVPMRELLEGAGMTRGRLHLRALDDYTFPADAAHLMEDGVLLATAAEGRPIPVADGGPIRVVFPPRSTLARNKDAWVWSLRWIEELGP